MKLSIVLLTWNSEKHVEKCIGSVLANTAEHVDYEIIVVDNGSKDNTLKIIKTLFPRVKLIKNSFNRGVAPARNQGIRAARGEYILLLDIDTYTCAGSIDSLLKYMENNYKVGLCGPQLCFEDGTVQYSCRRFPLLQTKILRRINTGWARRLLRDEYYIVGSDGTLTDDSHRSETGFGCLKESSKTLNKSGIMEVDYIIGACQLLRHSALEEVGLLDDKIFYGPEDVDLCLRMWLKGWKVAYLPGVCVIHYEQRITKSRKFSYVTLKHVQGLLYYFLKHRYLFARRSLYHRINREENKKK